METITRRNPVTGIYETVPTEEFEKPVVKTIPSEKTVVPAAKTSVQYSKDKAPPKKV